MMRARLYIFLLSSSLFIGSLFALTDMRGASAEDLELSFRWAIAARIESKGDEILPIVGDTSLKSGDLFKIFVNPIDNSYVYIYLIDSLRHVHLLFPRSLSDFDKRYAFGEKYYVPSGGEWLALDQNTGEETFHILASALRLRRLETLTEKYLAATKTAKESAAADLIAEIRDLKRRNSKFAAEPQKPVQIAGSFRGDADIEKLATRTSAKGFYSKTIRIEHK
ncbi:MAG: DUF4384 domain-containing protein [Deltaproteobacteria bacterium]